MYNEKSKQAITKYLRKLKEIRFRVNPEQYEHFKEVAEKNGYSSMRQFYLDAINDKIKALEKGKRN